MAISKKIRFEVFKRDSFTCQYCGRMAPDVILEVDHIDPKNEGGKDDILNFVTSCFDCNRGKSNRILSNSNVIKKKQKQLKELEQKRQQLKMMHEWELEILNIDNSAIQNLSDIWSKLAIGFSLNPSGMNEIRTLRKQFSDHEITNAIKIATNYFKYENGEITRESANIAWSKIGGICFITKKQEKDPALKKIYYIRGILKNKGYINEKMFWYLMDTAKGKNIDLDKCIEYTKSITSWTQWKDSIQEFIGEND